MSAKKAKVAALKKGKRIRSGASLISEVYVKEYDAQKRLGNSCCIFIKVKDELRFLVLTDNAPEFQDSWKFISVAIGASTSELGEAKDILNELGSSISDVYSSQDFYPTVALYFLSRYLKGVMEEFWSPRALAVEYMIYDPIFKALHTIKLNGDYESYNVGPIEKTFILVGGYNARLRRELQKELQKLIDKADLDRKTLEEFGDRICKKYGLRISVLLHPQIVTSPLSSVQFSGTRPDNPTD